MRQIYKQWKTPKGKEFTHRIRWYQEADCSNIRLQCETPEGLKNLYPKDKIEAQSIFDDFKATCQEPPQKPIPTLSEFLEGLEAESDEGRRRTISQDEAIKRYNKMYPQDC